MVSAAGHEEAQTGTSVVRSAQQTSEPGHGTVGQVMPPPLELPLPLAPPDPPPLELPPPELLPDDELPALASAPEPPPWPLLLLEQPVHDSAHATTAAAVREKDVREDMVASARTGGP